MTKRTIVGTTVVALAVAVVLGLLSTGVFSGNRHQVVAASGTTAEHGGRIAEPPRKCPPALLPRVCAKLQPPAPSAPGPYANDPAAILDTPTTQVASPPPSLGIESQPEVPALPGSVPLQGVNRWTGQVGSAFTVVCAGTLETRSTDGSFAATSQGLLVQFSLPTYEGGAFSVEKEVQMSSVPGPWRVINSSGDELTVQGGNGQTFTYNAVSESVG